MCPSVDDQFKLITANFSHIRELYNLELGKPIKMAFKLTDKVLRPSSLEKTNVKLADSCFHESTINAAYYSSHGYAKFKETAEVLQIIRDWFNTVNVKSAFSGQKNRDNRRLPIRGDDDGLTIRYLNDFRNWLWETWIIKTDICSGNSHVKGDSSLN